MTEIVGAAGVVRDDLESICARASSDLQALDGTSVVLTGGGGFLGYYLVQGIAYWNRHRAAERISLTVADNWIRGRPDWVHALDAEPGIRFVTMDVTEPWPADLAMGEWVVHAASIASPTYYRQHPIETMDANVGGLRRLLDECSASSSLRGLLFFSSSEVYGDPLPDDIPTSEDYVGRVSFTGPRACYDESKRYGETLCVNFAEQRGVPVCAVRPFNNYGPGLSLTDRRVIPDFARDILDGRDVTMFSSGRPTRTFCYVTDAIVAYLAALVRGVRGSAYNVGADGPEVSMRDLAERMVATAARDLGYAGRVVTAQSDDPEYLVDNPDRRCPDLTRLRTGLGVAPTVALDEGLRRSLIWYSDPLAASEVWA